MVKPMSIKGFTLLEMMVTLCIISLFLTLTLIKRTSIDEEYYRFSSQYLFTQSEALRKAQRESIDERNISFNAIGNVNKAQTILFSNNKKIIVELGGGRLAYK